MSSCGSRAGLYGFKQERTAAAVLADVCHWVIKPRSFCLTCRSTEGRRPELLPEKATYLPKASRAAGRGHMWTLQMAVLQMAELPQPGHQKLSK